MTPLLEKLRSDSHRRTAQWLVCHGDHLIGITVVALVAAAGCMPLLRHGASNPDSIGIYLDWLERFASQLTQGDLYPRWLMGMNHGAGSPVFYYYAPVAYYLASVPAIVLSGHRPTIQLAWADWLLIVMSGLAFYLCARRRFKVIVALPSATLYMLLPYHFEVDTYARQDIAELANYIWMPLVLQCVDELFERRRTVCGIAVSYALMLSSHLPTTLLFSVCLCGYITVNLAMTRCWSCLPRLGLGFGLGLLLAAVYLIPALLAENYVLMDAMWSEDFHIFFFPVGSLALYSNDVERHAFAVRTFTVVSLTTLMFCVLWVAAIRAPAACSRRPLIGCLILVVMSWFLMSSYSGFVWEHIAALRKTQFPWRLSMVVDLATAITALHALHALSQRHNIASILAGSASLVILAWCLSTAQFSTKVDSFYSAFWLASRDNAIRDGVDVAEYTTIWNHADTAPEVPVESSGRLPVSYDSSAGNIVTVSWRPRHIELEVRLLRTTRASVRQFYFPNWGATTDHGQRLSVTPSEPDGLLEMELPAGLYRLYITLAPLTHERVGWALSTMGVALVLCLSWVGRARHKNRSRGVNLA